MTEETQSEYDARLGAALVATFGAAAAAQIKAESDAMSARAEVYARALADQLAAIKALCDTESGLDMLMRIGCVIALDQLYSSAWGSRAPTWQEALERHRVLTAKTIEAIKPKFQREASN